MSRDELVWFKIFPKDILSDYRLEALGPVGVGAFFLLTFRSCVETPAGTLPGDEDSLQRMSRLTVEEWSKVREKLLVLFALRDDGRRDCPMVQEQLAERDSLSEKRRVAGSKGGRPRCHDRREHPEERGRQLDQGTATAAERDDYGEATRGRRVANRDSQQGAEQAEPNGSQQKPIGSFCESKKKPISISINNSIYTDHDAQMGWSSDDVRSACLGVTVEELKSPGALESRWKRLADAGAVPRTEDGFARVVALACRCLRLGKKNQPGLFVSMMRESKWNDLALQDLDEAHRKILRWRHGPQQRTANRRGQEDTPDSGPTPFGKAIEALVLSARSVAGPP